MAKIYKFQTLEEGILILRNAVKSNGRISIAQILRTLSGKGRPLILILVSLLFCQPLQIPGLSTPFGLIIAFIGLRMTFGKGFWLPRWLLSKTIAAKTLEKIANKALILARKTRRWIHPRLNWICQSRVMKKMNGLIIFILGLLLALPLPIPLSNFIAAWSIFLMALGILEDDGLFVLVGYLVFLLAAVFFTAIAMQIGTIF